MMSRRFTFAVLLAVLPAPAFAQIGSGWNEYMPGRTLQTRGCGSHSGSSTGVETFGLTCADTSGDNRAEDRMQDDYTSGTRQFQGEVRVVSLPGSNVSLKQTFMRDNGAFLMIGVSNEGRLYTVGDNAELATGVIGKWVRINTLHDVAAGTIQVYADGVLKVTKTGARQVAWYNKYGSYRLGSGHGPITVEWRNTRFWRDGSSSGGTPPTPAPDAGAKPDAATTAPDAATTAPDAREPDPDPTSDAASTGGASGQDTGGSAGSSTGGRTGSSTGGSKGTGGAEPEPDPGETGAGGSAARSSGCALGGAPGGALLPLALLLGALARRRRR
jgi:MYXO-CTERM domain-containing protein